MSIIIALIVFSLLILVHELGHFLFAKINGIGVTEFSVGMGPRLISWGKGETKYSIKCIPFGGSCAMVGEDADDPAPNAFNNKPAGARFSVIVAGPLFNLIFAFLMGFVLVGAGGCNPAEVYHVSSEAAAQAGIEKGDTILSVDGHRIRVGRDIEILMLAEPLKQAETEIEWLHQGEKKTALISTYQTGYRLGINYYANTEAAVLSEISEGSAAAEAGLKAGDVLLAVGGEAIGDGAALQEYFAAHPLDGSSLTVRYLRDGREAETDITPKPYESYELGFEASYLYKETDSLGKLLRYGVQETAYWLRYTFISLKMLFTGKVGLRDMSGPVGIVDTIGTAVDVGMENGGLVSALLNILTMIVLLNVNLGIMNLLPLPALDGGRLFFILIELLRGSPVPAEKEGKVHLIGFVLLMVLMVVILASDVLRLFGM